MKYHLLIHLVIQKLVITNFKGEYNETQSYAAGEIVRRQSSLWSADISITGAETNIQFDSLRQDYLLMLYRNNNHQPVFCC